MNLYYLSVGCPYCGAERHQPCRQTMWAVGEKRPVCDTHQARIDYADEVCF
jgi:hypothetical protein